MELNENILNSVVNGDIKVLYKHYRLLKLEQDITQKAYEAVRFGKEIEFDIHDFFDLNFTTKKKSGFVNIAGVVYDITAFRTELEYREDLMRKAIYEHMKPFAPMTPR